MKLYNAKTNEFLGYVDEYDRKSIYELRAIADEIVKTGTPWYPTTYYLLDDLNDANSKHLISGVIEESPFQKYVEIDLDAEELIFYI